MDKVELTIDEIDNLINMVSHKEGDIQYLESILVDDSNYGSYMDYNGSVYDFFRLALENKKQYLKLQEEWNNIIKKEIK